MPMAWNSLRREFKNAARHVCRAVILASMATVFAVHAASAQPILIPNAASITDQKSDYVFEEKSPTANSDRNFILIAGPGQGAFDKEYIANLVVPVWNSGCDVYLVGDSEHDINTDDIIWALEHAKQNGKKTTICVLAHGGLDNGNHYIKVGQKNTDWIASSGIFALTSVFYNKEVNAYILSCHGTAAVKDMDQLPDGSSLTVLSGAGEKDITEGDFILHAFLQMRKSIENDKGNSSVLTAEKLLYSYINNVNNNDFISSKFNNPAFAKKGCKPKTLQMAKDFLGKMDSWDRDYIQRYDLIKRAAENLDGIMTEKEIRSALKNYKSDSTSITNQRKALVVALAMLPSDIPLDPAPDENTKSVRNDNAIVQAPNRTATTLEH